MNNFAPPTSAGLGLRRAMLGDLMTMNVGAVDFLECAPDNWIGVGGAYAQQLDRLAERYPLTCHGLSLSLGGAQPLDLDLLHGTRGFLDRYAVTIYSEHLSYCSDQGHLYDLLPIPFTEEAVHHGAHTSSPGRIGPTHRGGKHLLLRSALPGDERDRVHTGRAR